MSRFYDSLVERVARAMCNSQGDGRDFWADTSPGHRDDLRVMARAAIPICAEHRAEWRTDFDKAGPRGMFLIAKPNPDRPGHWHVQTAYRSASGQIMGESGVKVIRDATHWLPLPPPPENTP